MSTANLHLKLTPIMPDGGDDNIKTPSKDSKNMGTLPANDQSVPEDDNASPQSDHSSANMQDDAENTHVPMICDISDKRQFDVRELNIKHDEGCFKLLIPHKEIILENDDILCLNGLYLSVKIIESQMPQRASTQLSDQQPRNIEDIWSDLPVPATSILDPENPDMLMTNGAPTDPLDFLHMPLSQAVQNTSTPNSLGAWPNHQSAALNAFVPVPQSNDALNVHADVQPLSQAGERLSLNHRRDIVDPAKREGNILKDLGIEESMISSVSSNNNSPLSFNEQSPADFLDELLTDDFQRSGPFVQAENFHDPEGLSPSYQDNTQKTAAKTSFFQEIKQLTKRRLSEE